VLIIWGSSMAANICSAALAYRIRCDRPPNTLRLAVRAKGIDHTILGTISKCELAAIEASCAGPIANPQPLCQLNPCRFPTAIRQSKHLPNNCAYLFAALRAVFSVLVATNV
jgi:hypothetical protein